MKKLFIIGLFLSSVSYGQVNKIGGLVSNFGFTNFYFETKFSKGNDIGVGVEYYTNVVRYDNNCYNLIPYLKTNKSKSFGLYVVSPTILKKFLGGFNVQFGFGQYNYTIFKEQQKPIYSYSQGTWVNSYYRNDGTYVRGYYRGAGSYISGYKNVIGRETISTSDYIVCSINKSFKIYEGKNISLYFDTKFSFRQFGGYELDDRNFGSWNMTEGLGGFTINF